VKHLLEPAYVLHYRPYRDTSLLVDFFTRDQGLIGAIARGVRGAKSPLKGLLQPFVPLLISFQSKKELALITSVEPNQANQAYHAPLTGKHLFGALYLNELLMKLLQRHDPHPQLYADYRYALMELSSCNALEVPLRRFEKKLIAELGYALNLTTEANTNEPIAPELFYQFFAQKGFLVDAKGDSSFQGKALLALAGEDFSDVSLMADMKKLLRMTIADLLGKHALKSRELFV
jgi:DNA repair protein RecO (recombination protein O)